MSLTIADCKVVIGSVTVQFSQPVDHATATTKSNYTIGGSQGAPKAIDASIEKIELDAAATSATVTFAKHGLALSSGQQLQVSGVETKDKSAKIAESSTTCVLTDGKKQVEAEQKTKALQQDVENLTLQLKQRKAGQIEAEEKTKALQQQVGDLKLQVEQQQSYGFCGLIKTKEGRPLQNYRFQYFAADGKQNLGTGSTDEDGMYSFDSKLPEVVLVVAGERHKLKAAVNP